MASAEGAVEALFSPALRLAWGFRLELGSAVVISAGWVYAKGAVGACVGSLAVGLPVVAIIVWPPSRRGAWRQLRCAHARRRFASAIRKSRFDPKNKAACRLCSRCGRRRQAITYGSGSRRARRWATWRTSPKWQRRPWA